MSQEEFWQMAYLAILNASKEPLSLDRSQQARRIAYQAIRDLDEYHKEFETTERTA